MTEPILLAFPRRTPRPVETPQTFYVVNLTRDSFCGMSRWHTQEQAEIAAGDMAEEYPGDEIAILHPVAVWQERGGALRRTTK
jgi:hypothetical protein